MNAEDALLRLGGATSEAVVGVLHMLAGEAAVTPGPVTLVPEGASPLEGVNLPAVATDVSYVDGVTGGNVMAFPLAAARRLANAMMGMPPEGDGEEPLSELELSAVGEAMNQMMSAAAMATTEFVGEEVEIAPPRTLVLEEVTQAREFCETTPYAVSAALTVFGVPCRLVQLVPNAFVVRMTRALKQVSEVHEGEPLRAALVDVPVRLWAELGRSRMPMARFVALPPGDVLELDREAEDPIDLYVNGMRFAAGRLLVTDEGELAIRIDAVVGLESDFIPNQRQDHQLKEAA